MKDQRKIRIDPRNLTAQLHYRAAGNPSNTLARSAISNCFPGLEFDFRNLWRRAFKGIVLLENNNYVIETDPDYAHLLHHRLLAADGRPFVTTASGPVMPGFDPGPLITTANPNGVVFLEWSNSLAAILQKAGQKVKCEFTREEATTEQPPPTSEGDTLVVELYVRRFFEEGTASFAPDLLQPGELTQGLCSPWQNDYRECACYYWAASRPDYVNVEPTEGGGSRGDNWMQKRRTGDYVLDDRKDSRLVTYDDLFKQWEEELHFIVKGRDARGSGDR
ncbi:MAG: hypothetical protein HUU21_07975 [Polyangiaceae bacterium]|nr:hypothetical protein [Polyangiaceae bacterium]